MSKRLHVETSDLLPEQWAEGLVVVAKANPSRGANFQIAHFRRSPWSLDTLGKLDLFQPTLDGALEWVKRHYPSAHIRSIGKRPDGGVKAVAFQCKLSDFEAEERDFEEDSF